MPRPLYARCRNPGSHWIKSLVDCRTGPDSAEKKILPYWEPKRGLSLIAVRHAQLCQLSRLPYSQLSSIAVAKDSSIEKFETSNILRDEINCTRHISFTTSYKCIGTILIFLARTNNLYGKFQTQLGHILFRWYLCRDCYVPIICGSGFTGLFVCVWS
jgi:hypothetical protein